MRATSNGRPPPSASVSAARAAFPEFDRLRLDPPAPGALLHHAPGRRGAVDDQEPRAGDPGRRLARPGALPRRLGEHERDVERRPATRGARQPDLAIHQADQALADREPEAAAAIEPRHRRVGLGVGREQLSAQVLRNADAGIAYGHAEAQIVPPLGDHADRQIDLASSGEFDGIAEEIEEDLPDPAGVAAQQRRYLGLDPQLQSQALVARARLDHRDDPLQEVLQIEIDAVELEAPCLHPREIENVVDDGEQRLARIVDRFHQPLLLLAERRLEQQARHADDPVHRLADLVAHGREEERLGLIGALRRLTLQPPLLELAAQGVGSARLAASLGHARSLGTVAHGALASRFRTRSEFLLFP